MISFRGAIQYLGAEISSQSPADISNCHQPSPHHSFGTDRLNGKKDNNEEAFDRCMRNE